MAAKKKAKKTGALPSPEDQVRAAEDAALGLGGRKGAATVAASGSGYRTRDGAKVRIGLALEVDTLNRLRAAAVEENVALSALVNDAIAAKLAALETARGKPYRPRLPRAVAR